MKRWWEIVLTGVLLVLLFAAVNLTLSWLGGGRLIDATSAGRYTLNEVSDKAATDLSQPVEWRLYVSDNLSAYDWNMEAYAAEVGAFLSRYRQAAPDKIRLQIRRPGEKAEMESLAANDGLIPLSTEDGDYYFGLKAVAADGRSVVIPAFLPERRPLLENDLTRMLLLLSETKKAKVGVVSFGVPPAGKNSPFKALTSLLGHYFDLSQIAADSAYIPQDIDVVTVINPHNLPSLFAYALDQYVMRGGKVVFLVDPYSEQQHARQGYPPRPNLSMNGFLRVWGMEYDGRMIAGDILNAEKIRAGDGRSRLFPLWFFAAGANGEKLHFRTPGSLRATNESRLQYEELAATGEQGGEIAVNKVRYTPKSQIILDYRQDNRRHVLALLAKGEFRSHFRDNPLAGTSSADKVQPYLPFAAEGAAVAVVADSDFAADDLWVASYQPENPVYGTVPYAYNGEFLLNLIAGLAQKAQQLPVSDADGGQPTNIAEKFYRESFNLHAEEREEREKAENDSAARLRRLQQKHADSENIMQAQQLQKAEDESAKDKRLLQSVNRKIAAGADNLLGRFMLMNLLVYPLLILIIVASAAKMFRARLARTAAEQRKKQ